MFNEKPNGYGYAVRKGLENFHGDCVVVTMADLSDDPKDIVKYYRKMEQTGCDMVFGSRWIKGAKVVDYPKQKLWLNRVVNHCIRIMFGFRYNDVTNGFKLFSKETMEGLKPFVSGQFSFFRHFLGYNAACIGGFIVKMIFLQVFVVVFKGRLDVVFCNLLALCFSGCFNYVINERVVFRRKKS